MRRHTWNHHLFGLQGERGISGSSGGVLCLLAHLLLVHRQQTEAEPPTEAPGAAHVFLPLLLLACCDGGGMR